MFVRKFLYNTNQEHRLSRPRLSVDPEQARSRRVFPVNKALVFIGSKNPFVGIVDERVLLVLESLNLLTRINPEQAPETLPLFFLPLNLSLEFSLIYCSFEHPLKQALYMFLVVLLGVLSKGF